MVRYGGMSEGRGGGRGEVGSLVMHLTSPLVTHLTSTLVTHLTSFLVMHLELRYEG